MHLTLAFIGWIDHADEASAALADAARALRPFAARLGAAGAFPNERRPRVVWVGLAEGAEEVREAAARVRSALAERSVPFDDAPAAAHVTIARLRDRATAVERGAVGAALAALRETVPALAFTVTEAHLFESTLSPRGPTYTTVARAALG